MALLLGIVGIVAERGRDRSWAPFGQSAAQVAPLFSRIPTICSSENWLLRIPSSSGLRPCEEFHYPWTSFRGARQTDSRNPPKNGYGSKPVAHLGVRLVWIANWSKLGPAQRALLCL